MKAVPAVDFRQVRLKAVIDWLEVEVKLSSPSQFRHLRQRMAGTFGNVYVKEKPLAELGNPDLASRVFSFKVQNPKNANQFMQDVQCMRYGDDPPITEADVSIKGIEVALDAYTRASDRAELSAVTFHFLKFQANRPTGIARVTQRHRFRSLATPLDALNTLMEAASINCGEIDADFRTRAYVKTYDTVGDDTYADLPAAQHRGRFEIILNGEKVPFTSIQGWRHYRFEGLAKDTFAMCKPSVDVGLVALVQARMIQLGQHSESPKHRPSDKRKRPPMTRRDSVLNDKIRMALRALTKSQSCENSVKTCGVKTAVSEREGTFKAVSPKYFKSTQSVLASGLTKSVLIEDPKVSQPNRELINVSSELLSSAAQVLNGEITDPELPAILKELAVQDDEIDHKNYKMEHPYNVKEENSF